MVYLNRALGVFLLSASLASLLLVVDVNYGSAQTQTQVSGVISRDTTWTKAGSPYVFSGAVGVAVGVTLTVEAGVTVELGAYNMEVNGTLNAEGTPQDKVIFNALSANQNILLIYGNPVYKLENTVLSHISIQGQSAVSNATLTIADSSLIDSSMYVWGTTTISDCYATGAVQLRGASTVSGSILLGGLDVAGSCSGSQFTGAYTVSGNNITSLQGGIVVNVGAKGTIKDNVIWGGRIGISQADGYPTMSATIENNLITGNQIGIYTRTQNDDSTINGNTIAGNQVGISNPAAGQTITGNNIENLQYNVKAGVSAASAPGNWWGTAEKAAISQSIYDVNDDFSLGTIVYTPFLSEVNSNAPQNPDDMMLPKASAQPTEGVTFQTVSHAESASLGVLEIGVIATAGIIGVLVAILAVRSHRRHRHLNA